MIAKPNITTASLLADLVALVCHPEASDKTKMEAIGIAYEIGKSEGRVDGAVSMGDTLIATFDKATAPAVRQ